ncbi:ABC-2 type transport system ATP-binding protein [Streptosporangium becharense]|uniref:ABC-2 type transport system ATP-binding protein n=1 Tax=Streptosporangium becharense TaxID=1816182 RepID=A0A7W9MID6_9ACTN|nr:ATP-binding cassette domain-containing protein [Streptosporangium becharense]MBB2913119.1 ABC-2 type transport system ATP-binding protein [Streptosporangium becharense]MBB5822102.1 ABC-2 type transport system ATP-binding protein [Streptosporangium becharense]
MQTSTPASLQAHALVKRYGDITAVDDLSFQVRSGVVTGFLGPNGAGKSTTLRMFLGLDKPTSGAASVDGHRLAELPHPMRVIGAMLDARAVHPRRTAADHLAAVARAGGVPRSRVAETLDLVGLAEDGGRPAGDFSLGMKQRLGIATALIGDPGIVIFDEPLNGLDPEGIRWARSLMRDLAAEGRTVLFSSHLMGEMELTADHLIVIHHGKLLADQPLKAFITAHTSEHVRVRTPDREGLLDALSHAGFATTSDAESADVLTVPDATTDRVGHIAAASAIELSELTLVRDSLEDAFLTMTATDHKAA